VELVTRIISMLVPIIPYQRKHAIREKQTDYNISGQASDFSLDSEIPIP
jgi:hypothetical protein